MKIEYFKNNKKHSKGFTVLEIIAVLFIIAILAVIAITRLTSITYYKAASETDILKANLRYAQFRALSDADTTYGVNNVTWGILLSGGSYTLQRNYLTANTNFPGDDSSTHNLPSGISINPATTITYNVWGIPVDTSGTALSNNVTITITDGTSPQTITVTKNTGFIQ